MRMPWLKPLKLPIIPPSPYRVHVNHETAPPKDECLVVEEHDTSEMTQTGVHKAWKRLQG
jgi:hypothetical protein